MPHFMVSMIPNAGQEELVAVAVPVSGNLYSVEDAGAYNFLIFSRIRGDLKCSFRFPRFEIFEGHYAKIVYRTKYFIFI